MDSGGIGICRLFSKYKAQLLILQNILPIYLNVEKFLHPIYGRLLFFAGGKGRIIVLPA